MAKTWVLETDTKGTGARVVPLEDALAKPEPDAASRPRPRKPAPAAPRSRPAARRPARPAQRRSTPLPAGHVRKKDTGEIGRVKAVDARAGTATVTWLKQGRTSTVPLAAVTRE
jgi:hypothetical protein